MCTLKRTEFIRDRKSEDVRTLVRWGCATSFSSLPMPAGFFDFLLLALTLRRWSTLPSLGSVYPATVHSHQGLICLVRLLYAPQGTPRKHRDSLLMMGCPVHDVRVT